MIDQGGKSRSQAPVHISGESGTGKELVARLMIHEAGTTRTNGPFVPVNCGAIPAELMESEFFGHKKGSFYGRGCNDNNRPVPKSAEGGTLFMDEIADLPLAYAGQVAARHPGDDRSARSASRVKRCRWMCGS